MTTKEQECQQLRARISDHETNIAQMEDLLMRTPSDGLRAAMDAEMTQRDQARARLLKLEEIILLEQDIQLRQSTVAQHEGTVQSLRDEREALQRRLTQAETDLNRTRIELNHKQDELHQKELELQRVPVATPAQQPESRPQTAPAPGRTVRLSQSPLALLRLENGASEYIATSDVVIGREKMNGVDIGLNEETVSGTHARILYSNNQWTITDLGSANGTRVGESQIRPHVPTLLPYGTTLYFGRVTATFEQATE